MKGKFSRFRAFPLLFLCVAVLTTTSVGWPAPIWTAAAAQAPPPEAAPPDQSAPPPEQPMPAQLSPEQLRRLVAPIALFPDPLVAQILAASAYPTQIVEADRLLHDHPNLQGAALADAVNQQDWDPSVKALTAFPTVLDNMDRSLSWTSELGDANYNQGADVEAAIQYLRHQAQAAAKLQSNSQQTVTNQGNTIVIQPANPQVVYVPEYDPALVYGYPLPLWPGFYPWWPITGPYISFGIGFGLGPFFAFGWGWPAWHFDWFHGGLFFHGRPYAFHSNAFYNRNAYFHGGFRGPAPFARGDRGLRGYGTAPGPRAGNFGARPGGGRTTGPAMRSWGRAGAFGGITRGGESRGFSSRGHMSLGGGFGGVRGGAGGMRGGGPRR